MKLLEFEDVRFGYTKSAEVLRGTSFSVDRGEVALIQGESGCGKTTTLYLAGGLLVATGGVIRFNGEAIGKSSPQLSKYRRDGVGFILQKYVLINEKSALENVMLPLLGQRRVSECRSRARELLGSLGLGEIADRPPYQLSSGQQQRVAFARAVISSPPLLLADEPTAALDPENRKLILELLSAYAAAGNAVVICSHDRPELHGRVSRYSFFDGKLHPIDNGDKQ